MRVVQHCLNYKNGQLFSLYYYRHGRGKAKVHARTVPSTHIPINLVLSHSPASPPLPRASVHTHIVYEYKYTRIVLGPPPPPPVRAGNYARNNSDWRMNRLGRTKRVFHPYIIFYIYIYILPYIYILYTSRAAACSIYYYRYYYYYIADFTCVCVCVCSRPRCRGKAAAECTTAGHDRRNVIIIIYYAVRLGGTTRIMFPSQIAGLNRFIASV